MAFFTQENQLHNRLMILGDSNDHLICNELR